MNNLIPFVAKWEEKYPILKKHRADRNIAYFTAWTSLCKCKGAYIRLTGLKGSIEEDDKNENIDAIRQVGTFLPGKCCRGRNRNNMCQENSSMEILETQERKMNKNKEKKRELTHFLGHYPLPKSVKGHGLSTERPITILQKE